MTPIHFHRSVALVITYEMLYSHVSAHNKLIHRKLPSTDIALHMDELGIDQEGAGIWCKRLS